MKPIAKYANHILLERIENEKVKENSSKAAIIIVSHEASRDGANPGDKFVQKACREIQHNINSSKKGSIN